VSGPGPRRGRPARSLAALGRGEILRVALQLIDEGGPEAGSLRAIAGVCGVTPMAILHHVKSHRQMLADLIAIAFSDVARVPEGATAIERLRFLMDRYCVTVLRHPNLIRQVLADPGLIAGPLAGLTDLLRSQLVEATGAPRIAPVLSLIVDHAHGFAFAAAAAPADNGPTRESYLASLDWILARLR
jgi:AcrR family transcriptional regulator